VCLRDGLWWSVYLTLARLRDAGAPGDVIRLVEQYDPATEVVIATEHRVRDGAATQIVSFAGSRTGRVSEHGLVSASGNVRSPTL
jgi:hypothetical protein